MSFSHGFPIGDFPVCSVILPSGTEIVYTYIYIYIYIYYVYIYVCVCVVSFPIKKMADFPVPHHSLYVYQKVGPLHGTD